MLEHNAPVRELVGEMLEGFGYAALDSGRPFEAIHTADYGGPITWRITNVVMPELDGRILGKTLTVLRPKMRMLYGSGFAIVEHCELEAGSQLLEKPFTRDALAKKARELPD